MSNKRWVLIIDDEENMRHMLSSVLGRLGYTVQAAENGQAGLEALQQQDFDVVLCDIRMPEMDGMEFLRRANDKGITATIIMMSAFGSMDTALAAIRLGAYDYISKPFKPDEIELTLRKAEEREKLRQDNKALRQELATLAGECSFGKMVGRSKPMQEVFALATKVAPHSTTVLVTGESGTGKELIAQGIHALSGRKGRFVPVNCGGLPENLIESELFGYKKGAFTGADRDRQGLFPAADKGTLFLDEIGELPIALQVKLLRVLQEEEVQPIGAAVPQKIDVRIIAATARDLAREVEKGSFRQDLYYRLNVVHIHVPPLRERVGDIPMLSEFFLKRYIHRLNSPVQSIAPAALSLLVQYAWPGNVRELENAIERAVVVADKNVVLPENLPAVFGIHRQDRRLDDVLGTFSIKQAQRIMERSLITRALEATGGNKSRAAGLLEISYPSLLSKIKEFADPDE
ncbi:sigma-54-dependent transcriptional regulator [Desulfobulbus oligotrophicus]|uniref:Sigma-54-dependent Fis family transcriptional regulator n=1 Tax=Desulfobulbus oligotrophicus TaxID=1909699 RepID=A0A7T5VDH9_9BACT|nr:sigma-54 dependent transcriptional regulator [Desulfobulbus oligotrophicus]QQG65909.1 sigma-54-dependent Fis family transcriptional regulator [Desulfobulbus oligotrophicus]